MKRKIAIAGMCIGFFILESCAGGHSTVRVGVGVGVPGPYYGRPYGRPHNYGYPGGGRLYPTMEMEKKENLLLADVKGSKNKDEQ